ncbi:hypothetical protein EI94DRAFT_1810347 [Lactarius quietus]|nr:hypothetical protein EI94DRAFT_1810347 [Lactarius quietus]
MDHGSKDEEGLTRTGKRQRSATNTLAAASLSQTNNNEQESDLEISSVNGAKDDDPKVAAPLTESDEDGSVYKDGNGSDSETQSDEEPGTPSDKEHKEGAELHCDPGGTDSGWQPGGLQQYCWYITKIQEVHLTPSRTNFLNANKSQKKKEISYKNLLHGTKNRFKTKVLPLALDTTGALKPWNTPGDNTIIEVWDLVFSINYPINEGDNECFHFIIVKTLIKHAISSWIHKFKDAAEKALGTEFTQQGFQTQEERAAFIQNILSNVNDMSDKKHPFIWESTYDDPSARQEVTLGFVRGSLNHDHHHGWFFPHKGKVDSSLHK